MKREHLLRVVEKAVARAMNNLVAAHPDGLQGYVAQSLEKRLIGMLGGPKYSWPPPPIKLRAPGERYKPSPAARQMQRVESRVDRGDLIPSQPRHSETATGLGVTR